MNWVKDSEVLTQVCHLDVACGNVRRTPQSAGREPVHPESAMNVYRKQV